MKLAPLLFFLAVVLGGMPHDQATKRSIAIIEKLKGKVVIDEKAPGRPVIVVNL